MAKTRLFSLILPIIAVAVVAGLSAVFFLTGTKGLYLPAPERLGAKSEKLPFPERMAAIRKGLKWKDRSDKRRLTPELLERSLALGKEYLINNQKPAGNFNYQYDFVQKTQDKGDSQVRQAGVLWGLSLIHRYDPDERTLAALNKGLDFFFRHTRVDKSGRRIIAYPGEKFCATGTVALTTLAIIETLRANPPMTEARRRELEEYLGGYLAFLRSLQLENGHFARNFNLWLKKRIGVSSPYFDGETLLALSKAARYLGRRELIPTINRAARAMVEDYTVKAWEKDRDSNKTKGFYQWGSMAFREIAEAGWEDASLYEDTALVLAWWMIHTHRTLARTRNTAYAHEGLAAAYALAERRNDVAAMDELAAVIDRGLYKLISWQVGGPLMKKNAFLRRNPTRDLLAVGGVMNHRSEPWLRIDVAQHQTHALILALENVYR